MPCGAHIYGSIQMTIHTTVLIETTKDLSSDLRWCSWKQFTPKTTLWLSLRVTNMLLCFPVKVRVSRSTGNASWIYWYVQKTILKVTDLTLLLMMGLTLLLPSMRVRRQINCSSRMILSLNPATQTMFSSIFSKP